MQNKVYEMPAKRSKFYDELFSLCQRPEGNFKKIYKLFPDVLKIPSRSEFGETVVCVEAMINRGEDQGKCIQLLDRLPWNKHNFHDIVRYSRAPIHWAIIAKKLDIVRYFITRRGVSPNLTDYQGKTLLHYAIGTPDLSYALSMTQMLIDCGADPRILAKPDKKYPKGKHVLDCLPPESRFTPENTPNNIQTMYYIRAIKKIINDRIHALNEANMNIPASPPARIASPREVSLASSSFFDSKRHADYSSLPTKEDFDHNEVDDDKENSPLLKIKRD